MPIYLLTAKSQNFYRVEGSLASPNAQESIRANFNTNTFVKLHQAVGTVSTEFAHKLFHEQERYLNDSAKAVIGAFNSIKTCQHNYAAQVELIAEVGEVQPFAKDSNSSGLAYSLALAQVWVNDPDLNFLKQLNESEVEKPNRSHLPIFATGSVLANGEVRGIGGVIDKLTQVCESVEDPKNNITEFIVFLPQENLEETYLNKLKAKNQYDSFIALQKRIQKNGHIYGISRLSEGLSKIYGDFFDGSEENDQDMGFVGLAPITFKHRWLFFSRDDLINTLQKRAQEAIEHKNLLTVFGYSGSGKSSVVMSGLAPKLLFSSSFSQHWGLARLNEIENLEQLLSPLLMALSKHLFKDGLPHVRGGVSMLVVLSLWRLMSSPRPWGLTK